MTKKRVIWGLIAAIGWVTLIGACIAIIASPGSKAGEKPLTWDELRQTPMTDGEIAGPITICQEFVKDQLQAPSTAKFPVLFDEYQTNRLISPEYSYNIEGYFDAQNAFGAMLRAGFGCKVEKVGEEEWRLIAVDIRE
jgi:hypothetical protein